MTLNPGLAIKHVCISYLLTEKHRTTHKFVFKRHWHAVTHADCCVLLAKWVEGTDRFRKWEYPMSKYTIELVSLHTDTYIHTHINVNRYLWMCGCTYTSNSFTLGQGVPCKQTAFCYLILPTHETQRYKCACRAFPVSVSSRRPTRTHQSFILNETPTEF